MIAVERWPSAIRTLSVQQELDHGGYRLPRLSGDCQTGQTSYLDARLLRSEETPAARRKVPLRQNFGQRLQVLHISMYRADSPAGQTGKPLPGDSESVCSICRSGLLNLYVIFDCDLWFRRIVMRTSPNACDLEPTDPVSSLPCFRRFFDAADVPVAEKRPCARLLGRTSK